MLLISYKQTMMKMNADDNQMFIDRNESFHIDNTVFKVFLADKK